MVYTPRFEAIDAFWAIDLLQYNERLCEELTRELADRRTDGEQLSYAMLADCCQDLGLLHYALGSSIEKARDNFAKAADAFLHVFKLRGTQPAFDATLVKLPARSVSPDMEVESEGSANGSKNVIRQPLHQPGESDQSVTNSRTGLRAMYLALIVGQPELAREIAQMVFDPPNAMYVGPDSVVCTSDEQYLAYSLKSYLLGDPIEALFQIRRIKDTQEIIENQARMIQALIEKNSSTFLSLLDELLSNHHRSAENDNQHLDRFISVPALGLSECALLAGIIQLESLPNQCVYLPLQMLQSK